MAGYRIYTKRHVKQNFLLKFLRNMSATNWIIFINIIFFIIIWGFLLSGIDIISGLALKSGDILAGKNVWTLLTHMFTHVMFFHLFVNMLSLMFIGNFIEKIIGKKRYVPFYLIAGLFAGIASVVLAALIGDSAFFGTSLEMAAVGASGALFGVAGLMMLLIPNLPLYVMFIPIPIKAKYAIPGILILFAGLSYFSGLPIGNTAHAGGFLVGVVYGIYLRNKYSQKVKVLNRMFVH